MLIALILLGSPATLAAEQNKEHINAARRAISQMEYSTAASELSEHLKQHPDDIRVMHLLAKTYGWDNRYEESIKVYNRLLKTNPDETEYLVGKAQALIWLEQYRQAIPLLEKAWELDSNDANILRNLILSLNQSGTVEHKQRAKELGKIARENFPNTQWDHIVD